MKLDRNITNPRRGKYALIKLRTARIIQDNTGMLTLTPESVDFGNTDDTDFFVIRLKDIHAGPALEAYAKSAEADDREYANEIFKLAAMARNHPNRRKPD